MAINYKTMQKLNVIPKKSEISSPHELIDPNGSSNRTIVETKISTTPNQQRTETESKSIGFIILLCVLGVISLGILCWLILFISSLFECPDDTDKYHRYHDEDD